MNTMDPVRLLPLFLASFLFLSVRAQDGEPFMNHFKMENVPGNRISSITQDMDNSMIFTGNTGVISFDSEEWKIHSVPNIPMAVSSDSDFPMIYVGGRGFFGYLLKTGLGTYEYHNLSEPGEKTGDIFRIYQTSRNVIFYGDALIAVADRNRIYDVRRFTPDTARIFSGVFIYRDKAYVNLLGRGIYELNENGMTGVESMLDFSGSEILFGIEYGDSNALMGLDNNTLYRSDGKDFIKVNLEDQEYLEESYLEGAAWLDTDVFALSTILGGCLIVNVASGKTINILNYRTGLPDDEIYAIGKDRNHGLWLAHQYGLTRVDVRVPFRSYENYPGLEGNLTAVAWHDSTLYVSTNEGIFYLEEKKDYLEKEIVVKVTRKVTPPPPKETETAAEKEPAAVSGEEEKTEEPSLTAREKRLLRRKARKEARSQTEVPAGEEAGETSPEEGKEEAGSPGGLKTFLQRIGGKTVETGEEENAEIPAEELPRKPVYRTRYVKQKIYSLQSISHEFTRIGEFEEKAKDLVPVGSRVLLATNEGLYEIVGKKLQVIREGWYVEGIFPTRDTGRIYVVTPETAYQLVLEEGKWETRKDFSFIEEEIYSVCEQKDSTIWLGCDNRSYRIRPLNNALSDVRSFQFHEDYYDPVTMRNLGDTVYFFLSQGIYYYMNDSIRQTGLLGSKSLSRIHLSTCAIAWVQSEGQWISFRNQPNYNVKIDSYLNLFGDIADLFLDGDGNVWVVSESSYLYRIDHEMVNSYHPGFELFLNSVYNEEKHFPLDQLHFDYHDRSLVFNLSAPFYLKDNSTSYQYYAEGMSEDWSEWNRTGELSFPVLPMGKYTLHVRARNVLDQVTAIKSFPLLIRPPWWLSTAFLVSAGFVLVLLVLGILRWRVRKLRKDKANLEQKVRERTTEIRRQKDEIAEQKKEIMDSIQYAQKIQKAVLPSDQKAEQVLPEHFILFLPRDIVSGDFYWISAIDHRVIFAAADCTGHGVPGAFMSMLGVSFLNEIVNKNKRLSAARILDHLRDNVKETLSQSEQGGTKDGMDIALCIFDREKLTLQYAGAFNPLYLIRKGELIVYRADAMPIGIHIVEETGFRNHTIKVEKGDCFYIFSDGFQDQFGGGDGKKFLSKSMKHMFTEVHEQPMPKQKELIQERLQLWMNGYDQVDDIMILGVRI